MRQTRDIDDRVHYKTDERQRWTTRKITDRDGGSYLTGGSY